ncbi:TPA: restriction endonuclease subunit S [Vibrio vulnificus]|nr:restriction endonuclease subunit S [Vibrio vulnificus]
MKSDINLKHLAKLEVLPSGWAHSSVGELCIIEPVGNKKLAQKKYLEHGDYPVVDQGAAFIGGYSNEKDLVIDPPKNGAYLVFGDHSRAFKLIDFSFIPGADGVKVLKPVCVLPKWIYYFCQAIPLPNKGYARHFQYLKEAYLPLPPLSNQKLIVEKIEELFSHIDAGVEGLKQAKAKLQHYRQSVLKDAVTGKLTEQWRAQNADKLEPAEHLLERILDERRANWEAEQLKAFEEKGKTPKNDKWKDKYKEPPQADLSSLLEIPDSWTWTTITQLGELNRGKSKHRPRNDPSLYGGDYPFVQTGDVRAADGLLTTYKQTYSEKGLSQSRLWPKGTMCITIAANIAETAILGFDACFPDSVVGFIPQNESVSVEYIEFFFRTAREDLDRYAPATAQKNINLAILETVSVPFMSIEEQKELVLQVTEKLEATNRAEATIDEKIQHSASLKSSILAKAFSGELVPNNCNESAKELLDQVKAEKEALAGTKPKRSTKRKKKVTSGRKPLLTVLNEQSEPLKPDELMQLAGFSSNEVEEFYIKLAEIAEQVEQLSPEANQIKNWPYEKESEIKLKLKG